MRGLVPYISAEHHEVQTEQDATANADSMLEVAVGDHLLLPQGSIDVLWASTRRQISSTMLQLASSHFKWQLGGECYDWCFRRIWNRGTFTREATVVFCIAQ